MPDGADDFAKTLLALVATHPSVKRCVFVHASLSSNVLDALVEALLRNASLTDFWVLGKSLRDAAWEAELAVVGARVLEAVRLSPAPLVGFHVDKLAIDARTRRVMHAKKALVDGGGLHALRVFLQAGRLSSSLSATAAVDAPVHAFVRRDGDHAIMSRVVRFLWSDAAYAAVASSSATSSTSPSPSLATRSLSPSASEPSPRSPRLAFPVRS